MERDAYGHPKLLQLIAVLGMATVGNAKLCRSVVWENREVARIDTNNIQPMDHFPKSKVRKGQTKSYHNFKYCIFIANIFAR